MLLATTLQSHTEAMPGLLSLGEKRWSHPLPLAIIPPGAWHRFTPLCLCAPWHPSHGLICHSLTLAPSTGLVCGRQLSGPGQHLPPYLLPHKLCLSIVRDINIQINQGISKVIIDTWCCSWILINIKQYPSLLFILSLVRLTSAIAQDNFWSSSFY